MPVRRKDNTALLLTKQRQSSSLFLRFFLDDIERYSEPITPKKDGYLRRSTIKSVLGLTGTIMWDKEYAAAQEAGQTRGRPIRFYTTPGTGPKYAKKGVQKAMIHSKDTMRKAGLIS